MSVKMLERNCLSIFRIADNCFLTTWKKKRFQENGRRKFLADFLLYRKNQDER
jgi:hypothetical protein